MDSDCRREAVKGCDVPRRGEGAVSWWSVKAVSSSMTPIWPSTFHILSACIQGINFFKPKHTLSELLRLIHKTRMPMLYFIMRKNNCHAGWNKQAGKPVPLYPHQHNYVVGSQTAVKRFLDESRTRITGNRNLTVDLMQWRYPEASIFTIMPALQRGSNTWKLRAGCLFLGVFWNWCLQCSLQWLLVFADTAD